MFMFFHHLEQIHGTNNVILIVQHGFLVTLTDGFFGCKMHDTVNWFPFVLIFLEQSIKTFKIHDISFVIFNTFVNLLFRKGFSQYYFHSF